MPMTNAQARVVDPVLSSVALGYANPDLVGSLLFPRVASPKRGARVIKFGKEAFFKYNAARAPGARTGRVMYGYLSDPIALIQESLEGQVPIEWIEEAQGLPNVDHETRAVNNVMASLLLNLEAQQAGLATNLANYDANHKLTLGATDVWNNGTTSDPAANIRDAKEAIRKSVGAYPNTLIAGPDAWNAIQTNNAIKDQFKYTSPESITKDMVARYFQVDTFQVGSAVSADPANPAADFVDVWGNSVVLAFVPKQNRNIDVPSFGYTYELPGHPQVMTGYWEDQTMSYVYPVEYERQPYLTGQSAGFLITNVKG